MFNYFLYYLKRPFHFFKTGILRGVPAQLKYRFPARKLQIICVTGTDGKTSSSTLLYYVLKNSGKKVALLSTVAGYIGHEEIDTGFHVTTPDPKQLQRFMRKLVNLGYEYLVLEATSHGIYQHRLWGVKPFMVGVTNITNEHLDYHLDHDHYVQAKAILVKQAKVAVINADDDQSYLKLKRELKNTRVKVISYSLQEELPRKIQVAIKQRFTQPYNWMNARLVWAMAQELNLSEETFVAALEEYPGVPGRMQTVSSEHHPFEVIVDFAHTPNALDEALIALRRRMKSEDKKGRLIAVFGCAGLRDVQKRAAMGKVAGELADLAIFTAEDPRTENVWSIIRQMKSEVGENHSKIMSVADRREAIFFAIQKLAKAGDVIGFFGKGHEKSMCYGRTEYPWSDVLVATEALQGGRK